MNLDQTSEQWEKLAKTDPLWAVLSWPGKKGGKWNLENFFLTGVEEVAQLFRDLESLSFKFEANKALDFGCGVGRVSQALANYFTEVVGLDISPTMIKLAMQYNKHANCKFLMDQSGDLALFADKEFSFIYSRLTLQHIEPKNVKSYLREFVRLLDNDGIAVFYEPAKQSFSWRSLKNITTWRGILNIICPVAVLNLGRRIWAVLIGEPAMQMYAIEPAEIVELLQQIHQVSIVDIREKGLLSPGWHSMRYVVQKL